MFECLTAPPSFGVTLRQVRSASGASVVMHSILVGLVFHAATVSPPPAAEPAPDRQVQFVSVSTADERPSPPPAPAEAAGAPIRAAPKYLPGTGEAALAGDAPAGFKELRAPTTEMHGIPAVDSTQRGVDTSDFSGRGVIGGSGNGKAPDGPLARTASEVMRAGDSIHFDPNVKPGATLAPPAEEREIFEAGEVVEMPTIEDPEGFARTLQMLFPQEMQKTGISGHTVVEFILGTDGKPEMPTAHVTESTHPRFSDATMRALQRIRLKPARGMWHGKMVVVRMRIILPIDWIIR